MTYQIWDKTTPINGCPAAEAMAALGIRADDDVYLLCEGTRVAIVQTGRDTPYPRDTIEASAAAHIAALEAASVAEQTAEEQITELQLALAEVYELLANA